jgi:ABC-type nickel/cobalt efflux system permease component RcnA
MPPNAHLQRKLLGVLLACCLGLGSFSTAFAHPLGNFTINRYSRLQVDATSLHLLYVVDMAEIPAHAERAQIDADGSGVLSDAELQAYRSTKSTELTKNLHLSVADRAVPLQLLSSSLLFGKGQAGLPTLRLELRLQAALSSVTPNTALAVHYRDANYADRIGWQEVTAAALDGATIVGSSVPAADQSGALMSYREDLLNNPPQVTAATFTWQPPAAAHKGLPHSAENAATLNTAAQNAAAQDPSASGAALVNGRPADPFAELVAIPDLGIGAVLLALLAALGWGALHALSPGHGKTLVAAYLVGSQGTARHALFLGLTTTVTHTAGVFALGFVTLALSKFILPEQLYPWLSAASGVLVVLIGLSLARRRFGLHHEHGHEHGHQHPHVHSHGDGHAPDHDHTHEHHAHHAHHAHAVHVHSHDGAHGHSHLPPGAGGEPVTWRGLLALGVSGGLLPCPSALVLMLGAISLNRIGFGLLLIIAFSLGLAGVLTLFGIALVHAGKLFERIPEGGRLLRLAPAASALFITAAGLLITAQALGQTGLFSRGGPIG